MASSSVGIWHNRGRFILDIGEKIDLGNCGGAPMQSLWIGTHQVRCVRHARILLAGILALSVLALGTSFAPEIVLAAAGQYRYPYYDPQNQKSDGFGVVRPDGSTHLGIDYPMGIGTPVYASRAGVVDSLRETFATENSSIDNQVVVRHDDGELTAYAHLRYQGVVPIDGQSVSQGELIGWSGCSGNCFGPHLHFELKDFAPLRSVDPEPYYVAATADVRSYPEPLNFQFQQGSYVGYQFNSQGAVTGTKSGSIPAGGSSAAVARRTALARQNGTWLYMANGHWSGYYLRDSSRIYEPYSPTRTIYFQPGTWKGYRFDADGQVLGGQTGTIGAGGSNAPANARAMVNGQPWFRISAGIWSGYWLKESANKWDLWSPTHTIHFEPGTWKGFRFDESGTVLGSNLGTIGGTGSSAPSSGRAWINGDPFFRITAGEWAGYWIAESANKWDLWSPTHTIHFAPGTWTGYRFAESGAVTDTQQGTIGPAGSNAPSNGRAIINGRDYFHITAGIWADFWVPASAAIVES